MTRYVLLNEAGKGNRIRRRAAGQSDPRVIGIAEGQAVFLRLIAIQARQPLRAIVDRGQHIRAGGELHRSAVDTGLRVNAESNAEWRSRPAQIPQSAQIQLEPRVGGEQHTQTRHGVGRAVGAIGSCRRRMWRNSAKDRFGVNWMPQQESGVRPAAALPYQLYAEGSIGPDGKSFEIALEARDEIFGKRSAGSPFHVYAKNQFRGRSSFCEPAVTTVAAGDGARQDSWAMEGFENGIYDLHVHGPNGFYRALAGTAADPRIDVHCEYALTSDLEFRVVSRGDAYTIHIADNAYGGGSHTLEVPSAGKASIALPLGRSFRWYDFSRDRFQAPLDF